MNMMYHNPATPVSGRPGFLPVSICNCCNSRCGQVGRCLGPEHRWDTGATGWPGIFPEPKKVDEVFKSLVGEIDKEIEEVDSEIKYVVAEYSYGAWTAFDKVYDTYEDAENAAKDDLKDDEYEQVQILSTIAYIERPPVTEAVVRRVVN